MLSSATEQQTADLRYPVGRHDHAQSVTPELRQQWLEILADAPARFRSAVGGLTEEQLDTPYRPGGWTVRQVVHHVPDSHMNSYVRFHLALTEDVPTIKPYDEARWAELPDGKGPLVETSLSLLECLHKRWVFLLRSLSDEQWKRIYNHPEMGVMSLEQNLGIYAWHCRHHLAHITNLRERMGW